MIEQHLTWKDEPDNYLLLDSTEEFASEYQQHGSRFGTGSWYGGIDWETALRRLRFGDNGMVAASDRIMAELEGTAIHTPKWTNIDDCVGALPNVPALLAGHPMNMRRRKRLDRDDAPIAVFIDLTSSAGISPNDVLQRGSAVLALVRLLSDHRATTLWAGTALSLGDGSATIAWRIDTAPLDLARAAFALCSPAVSRGLGYNLSHAKQRSGGGWPFRDYDIHCKSAQTRLERVLDQKVLYIPPIMVTDDLISRPTAWIKRELEKYTHKEEE